MLHYYIILYYIMYTIRPAAVGLCRPRGPGTAVRETGCDKRCCVVCCVVLCCVVLYYIILPDIVLLLCCVVCIALCASAVEGNRLCAMAFD